jgi:3-oxoacyl-[acyl-carrier-protein] synthase II
MGESSAAVIIEELDQALARNAPIYCEILGSGHNSDAFHLTRPQDDGLGLQLTMKSALDEAEVEPSEVDHICTHGTITPAGDECEIIAIR